MQLEGAAKWEWKVFSVDSSGLLVDLTARHRRADVCRRWPPASTSKARTCVPDPEPCSYQRSTPRRQRFARSSWDRSATHAMVDSHLWVQSIAKRPASELSKRELRGFQVSCERARGTRCDRRCSLPYRVSTLAAAGKTRCIWKGGVREYVLWGSVRSSDGPREAGACCRFRRCDLDAILIN